jgi:two-component system chemotaxis sensor kinase CheA
MSDAAQELEALTELLYLAPFALARVDPAGTVDLMNSKGAQLLMQANPGSDLMNLWACFADDAPDLPALVAAFTAPQGTIVEGRRIEMKRASSRRPTPLVLSLDLIKLSPDVIMAGIADVSRLEAADRARLDLLDNVSDALCTIDRQGALGAECSAAFARVFGAQKQAAPFWSVLGGDDDDLTVALRMGWEAVIEDVLPLEVNLAQLPATLVRGGRTYQLLVSPLLDEGGALKRALLCLRDVTAEVEHARLEHETRDLVAALARLSKDREGFRNFFLEGKRLVEALVDQELHTHEAKRLLHTLKGNSSLFGLSHVAALCHDLEDRLVDGDALTRGDQQQLRHRWGTLSERFAALIGDGSGVFLKAEELDGLADAVDRAAPDAGLGRRVRALRDPPVEQSLARLGDQAKELARRLDRAPLQVVVKSDGARLPEEPLRPFFQALVHAIRNAVDHGLECASERVAAGKPEAGVLWLESSVHDDTLHVLMRDDGRGIDWSRVAARARARGMPTLSDQDLIAALFQEGISTREVVNDVSGRGVGMGALREVTERLGGDIHVESTPGEGTALRFQIPLRLVHAWEALPPPPL